MLVASTLGAVLALGLTRVVELDTPWYLRTGEHLLAHRALPERDPLSYTSAQPWLNHEYLAEVLLALAHRLGGWAALGVLQAGALGATLACLLAATKPRSEAPLGWALRAAMLAPTLVLLRENLSPRATLFALPLEALALAACARLARGELRWSWVPAATGLALTQVHGGNPAAVLLLVALAAALRDARTLGLLGLQALLTCAGPFGWRVHEHFAGAREQLPMIVEWRPLAALLESSGGVYWLAPTLCAAAAGILLLGSWEERRERVFLGLALLGWSVAAWRFQRFLVEASLVASVCVVRGVTSYLSTSTPRRTALVAAAGLSVAALCLAPTHRSFGVGLEPGRFPEEAARFVRERGLRGPLFNSYNFGGYLTWALGGERVFIDGRAFTVYSPALLASLEAAYREPARFAELEARWGFRLAIVQRAGRGAGLLRWLEARPEWRVVHRDARAEVLVREDPAR